MDGCGCRARLTSDGCSGSGSECNAACGHCPGLHAPRVWIGRATCDRPSNPSSARLACAHSSPRRNCACRPLTGGAVLPGAASRLRSHRVGAGTGLHARLGDGHTRATAPSPGEGDLALCCCRIWSMRRSRCGHRRCRFSLGTRRCLVRYNSSFRGGRSDRRCCGRTPSELGICRRLRVGAGGMATGYFAKALFVAKLVSPGTKPPSRHPAVGKSNDSPRKRHLPTICRAHLACRKRTSVRCRFQRSARWDVERRGNGLKVSR
jgi:hypothetical protein